MLSLVTPDQRVPKDHPLRKVKTLADAALAAISSTFDEMYSKVGQPSIPPERLLKSTLLMASYSVRSERLFCEQLDYNLLFRWFLDMDGVEESFDHSTFSRNRQRLVDLRVDPATGYGERAGALAMLDEHVPDSDGVTLGADAGYDTADFVAACRERGITPDVAQTRDQRRRSTVDGRTVRHSGYEVSQRIRKRVEEIFGWTKTVASFRKTRFRGQARTQLAAHLVAAAYNLLQISKLMP
ncbi:MAG: transposase, partial [Anaeromyxobacteraceae bacterium]